MSPWRRSKDDGRDARDAQGAAGSQDGADRRPEDYIDAVWRNDGEEDDEEDEGDGAHAAWTELIKDQAGVETAGKTSLEQRGVAIVTTSGVLASLLFGLAALARGSAAGRLPGLASWALGAAVACFVAAAAAALAVNAPMRYAGLKLQLLDQDLDLRLAEPAALAGRQTLRVRLKLLQVAQRQNNRKGVFLLVAMAAEVAAVSCLAVAVVAALVAG
jgi:hypothetical protein